MNMAAVPQTGACQTLDFSNSKKNFLDLKF